MNVKSESEVAQSCPTLSDPMDCSLPGSSAHGILQARVLEWGAIAKAFWLCIKSVASAACSWGPISGLLHFLLPSQPSASVTIADGLSDL